MHFARRRKEELSLNLTPLIDVVFLLLIFFMVTTTFTKESRLTLELPEATGNPPKSNQAELIEITVSASGEYAVNGRQLNNNKLETLKRAISEIAEMDTSMPIVITADANATHQAVVRVMDAAGQAGFVHLSLTAQQPEGPES